MTLTSTSTRHHLQKESYHKTRIGKVDTMAAASARRELVRLGAPSDTVSAVGGMIRTDAEVVDADEKSEHSGTGPVPLRGMQTFANQENVRPRNPPSSTSRLPNGKLGECHVHLFSEICGSQADAGFI